MRRTLTSALIGGAAASGGGTIKLNWSDCGDSSTHGHITSLSPTSVTLGTKTSISGKGKVDEQIPGATYKVVAKEGFIPIFSHSGDACKPDTIKLPAGAGQIDMKGFKCPISPGAAELDLDLTLSSSIPAKLARITIDLTAKSSSGDKALCVQIKTAPENLIADGENLIADVHPDRVAMIKEIENTPGVLWKAAPHPRFASQAPGASKDLCGVNGDQTQNIKDLIQKGEIEEAQHDANAVAPENFDSAQNWPQCAKIIGDIRDQSNCGCCWAFAGAEAASDRMCIATNATIMVPLSAQDVCFNGGGFMSMGCNGGQISSPWSYIKKGGMFGGKGAVSGGQYQGTGPFGKGFCSDFSLPHCHHHGPQRDDPYPAEGKPGCPHENSPAGPKTCDADAKSPHSDFNADKYSYAGSTVTARGEAGIQQAIMAGGPMEVAFSVYSDFENYAGGIYHHVSGGQVGGHAVKVVGWGVDNGAKYWKIANSWNPYWGEKGYFRIRRGTNEGGIEDQAIASSPTAKWSRAGDAMANDDHTQSKLPPIIKKLVCELANKGEGKAIDLICKKVPIPDCQGLLGKVFDKLLAKCAPSEATVVV